MDLSLNRPNPCRMRQLFRSMQCVSAFVCMSFDRGNTAIALFYVDEPVFDEMGMLTSWTILQGILRIEASWFLMRIQVLGT